MSMVIGQIIKDLRKEWSWVLFYSVVATMTLIAVLYLSMSFSHIQRQSQFIRSFVRHDVVMFQEKTLPLEPNSEAAFHKETHGQDSSDLGSYLQHILSEKGNAGSYFFIGNGGEVNSKYDQILILFGQYGKLMGLDRDEEMVLFTPKTHREDVGKTISISGRPIKVLDCFQDDFLLFHPLYSFDASESFFSNTLILCTTDFQTVEDLFPLWKLKREVFERMVLIHPSYKEVETLQDVFYKNFGTLYEGVPTEDFTRVTTFTSIRAHKLYLLFYILAGILLVVFFVCNIIRVIEAHIADYTVHHLYGATVRTIMLRVGGFVFAVHLPLLLGILWFILISGKMSRYVFPLSFISTLSICLFAAEYAAKRISTMNELSNLRRGY